MGRSRGGYIEETLVPSAARTTSGDTGILDGYGPVTTLRVQLNVTATSGTPSLVVFVEDTLDGTNWNTVDTFATKTAVGREVRNITAPFAGRIRIRWAITGGTPSATFEVIAVSQTPSVA